jgi:prepilin-type N-terminal cleavage/methylation domain-containing protein
LRRRLRLAAEGGYSLVELLIVMMILGVILASLTTLFTSASTAQVNLTERFQAQQDGRLALDTLRREIHCANVVTPATATNSITLTLSTFCPTAPSGGGDVTWCTTGTAPRYALWRAVGTGWTCTTGTPTGGAGTPVKKADFLTLSQVFTGVVGGATTGSRATIGIDLPVDVKPSVGQIGCTTGNTARCYELKDNIVLRNTSR